MGEFIEYTVPVWRGLNMRELEVDEAFLFLKSLYNQTTYLYTLSEECYTCPFIKVHTLKPLNDEIKPDVFKINVAHAVSLRIMDSDVGRYGFDNQTALCEMYQNKMQEFGVYNLSLHANGSCVFQTDKPGVNIHLSIFSVLVLIAIILCILRVALCAWRTYHYDDLASAATTTTQIDEVVATRKQRMRSLDTFRGLAIVLMIFVNSGGGAYWWIEHAPWNGIHLADFVFPSFLWIMGVCIPISVKSQLTRGTPKFQICGKIAWRSLKLFAIGFCLNSINGPQLENLRIMGVLQRFGVAFLVCGVVHTCFSQKDIIYPQNVWKRSIFELIMLKGELLLMLCLICVYLGITFGLSVPGCPIGYLGPGGKHALATHPQCIGGAAGYIDKQILGNTHIYQHPSAKHVYDSTAFDPEGIFGCLLTIVQVLFGLLAGMIILIHNDCSPRIIRWLAWSFQLAVLGGLLCLFSKEGGIIPINKNLWSLSFVFTTSSAAFFLLSLLYVVIDVRHWWTGFPFEESGKNAIIMYIGHTVLHKMLPWHWKIEEMNTHFVLLLESVWNTMLWIIIALYLNAKRFFYSL